MAVNPTFTPPTLTETYTPTSASDLESNQDKIAIITNSFDATGVTLASGQIIRPNGGVISGTNINLNDAYIEEVAQQAFSSSVTFTNLYDKSRIYPELFGANGDGVTEDINYITTAIEQCAFIQLVSTNTYVINTDRKGGIFNPISRSDILDFDLSTATITTTDNSTFHHMRYEEGVTPPEDKDEALSNQGYYILPFADFDILNIYNGEFDGNDLASRFIDIKDCKTFLLDNLNVHNLEAPEFTYARAVAFNFSLNPTTGGFTEGYITNNTIENINIIGDDISNNAQGISKALTFSITENGAATINIQDNLIKNITGDDAEGFYSRGDGNYTNATAQLVFNISNNDFIGCSRRAIKFDCSNAIIEDNYIESLPYAAQSSNNVSKQASLVQAFSIEQGVPVKNIQVRRNNIRVVGTALNALWGTNDSKDVIVEDNIFYADVMGAQRTVSVSTSTTQSGLYSGDVSNYIFRNNTITNVRFNIGSLYNVLTGENTALIENNTFTYNNVNTGKYYALIESTLGSGDMLGTDNIKFKNNTYNINYNVNTFFQGLIGSQGINLKNITLEDCTIDYTNSNGTPAGVFANTSTNNRDGSFDSTNLIKDCTIIGFDGTDAIKIGGADKSVVIQNSYGDNSTPITVEGVSPVNRPVITLNGSTPVEITQGGTYTELGATWADTEDGTGNATVGGDTVDTSIVGTYVVTYNHTDTDGNAAVQVTRTVNVVAEASPVEDSYGIDFNLFLSI